jgi:hypothetical protein
MATTTQSEGEGRALSAALASPAPFTGRAASLALHASSRHVDRWAPEHGAVERSRPLGTLSFVDRLLMPWMTATAAVQPTPLLGAPAASERMTRSAPASWLFPRPWFQDELDWVAADREAAHQSRSGMLTTRGTYSAPMGRTAAQSVVAVGDGGPRLLPAADVTLAYVAPSLAASASDVAPQQSMTRSLRAWSPQVPFAVVQAAEVMAATVSAAEHAGLTTATRSPVLEGLSYVAPAEVAGAHAQATDVQLARTAGQLAAVQAVARSRDAATARATVAQVAAPTVAATTTAAGRAEQVGDAYRASVEQSVEQPARELVELAASSPAAAQAMRGVELLARGAIGGQVASVSGPRVAMPAGLGGALAGFEAAATAARPMIANATTVESFVAPSARAFAPVWTGGATASALGAAEAARPQAMTHLAWADRWLARMAGASTASLAAFDVAAERPVAMPRATADVVYVVPDAAQPREAGGQGAPSAWTSPARPAPVARPVVAPAAVPSASVAMPAPAPTEALRIDDDQATPDEVLAAIARAARPRVRDAARPTEAARAEQAAREAARDAARVDAVAPQVRRAAEAVVTTDAAITTARPTLADAIVRSAPMAPTAGVHAGLASSPIAPALGAMMPLPAAPVFDPRALFGAGALTAYATGALSRDAFVPTLGATLAQWLPIGGAVTGTELAGVAARAPQATFVAPDAIAARSGFDDAQAAARGVAPARGATAAQSAAAQLAAQVVGAQVATSRAAATEPSAARAGTPGEAMDSADAGLGATATGAMVAGASATAADAIAAASGAGTTGAARVAGAGGATAIGAAGDTNAMWTLRAPLLMQAGAMGAIGLHAPLTEVGATGWSARPGMTAELAHDFSVRNERAAADLAFDFVPPEVVLAARVYGFGAAEAAQAARLALAGPAGLAAMASAIDLTFLRQLHVEADRREAIGAMGEGAVARRAPSMTAVVPGVAWDSAAGAAAGAGAATGAGAASMAASALPMTSDTAFAEAAAAGGFAPTTAWPTAQAGGGTVFGVDRRLPRGAFLWPAGAVAALDLRADGGEGVAGAQTVAALELLAAGAVAVMGAPGALVAAREYGAEPGVAADGVSPTRVAGRAPSMTAISASALASGAAAAPGAVAAPSEEVATYAAQVPAADRPRFQSIYLALSQSAAGRSLSPSVRAARALAIAAGQEPAESAVERARLAWSVMPAVYATPSAAATDETAAPSAWPRGTDLEFPVIAGEPPRRGRDADDSAGADLRPGLGRLAARAGEAIGSYVRPSGDEVARASSGAVRASGAPSHNRAEPLVHELIRGAARGFSRAGGGEAEIPAWFEKAAHALLDQRGLSETISVAEMTLIATAQPHQVAASTRGSSPAPSMAAAPTGASGAEQGEKPDIDKLASEVYAEILRLLEVARERSGDPWV